MFLTTNILLAREHAVLTPATFRAARSGPSGMVQLAFNRETQEQVAIKFLLRGNTFNAPSIVRELQNHRLCHLHPHIVPLRVRASLTTARQI